MIKVTGESQKGFISREALPAAAKGKTALDVLGTLSSTDRTILQLIDAAKKMSLYLSAEVAVASRLFKVEGKSPADKATIETLSAHVLSMLLTGISTEISSLSFKKKSAFSENDSTFTRDVRNTIAKIKKSIVVYFKLAEKTYGPDYLSPSKGESRWDSRIASVEYALPEERSVFSRIGAWFDDLFTPAPIKITVGASGARTGPMPHYQTIYVGGTASKQFFMG